MRPKRAGERLWIRCVVPLALGGLLSGCMTSVTRREPYQATETKLVEKVYWTKERQAAPALVSASRAVVAFVPVVGLTFAEIERLDAAFADALAEQGRGSSRVVSHVPHRELLESFSSSQLASLGPVERSILRSDFGIDTFCGVSLESGQPRRARFDVEGAQGTKSIELEVASWTSVATELAQGFHGTRSVEVDVRKVGFVPTEQTVTRWRTVTESRIDWMKTLLLAVSIWGISMVDWSEREQRELSSPILLRSAPAGVWFGPTEEDPAAGTRATRDKRGAGGGREAPAARLEDDPHR